MSNATEPNVPELDALLAWAEVEHAKSLQGLPSEWDQGHWATDYTATAAHLRPAAVPSCGTACCIAGKAVARIGGQFIIDPRRGYAFDAVFPDGRRVEIDEAAQEILGLTRHQAEALFYSGNSIEDVRRIIQDIQDGDPYPMYDEHPDADIR